MDIYISLSPSHLPNQNPDAEGEREGEGGRGGQKGVVSVQLGGAIFVANGCIGHNYVRIQILLLLTGSLI